MKSVKSLKHFVVLANAHLEMAEAVIKTTKTFINNKKLIATLEEVDSAIQEAAKEAGELHGEAIMLAQKKIRQAEKFEDKEETMQ